MCNIAGYVGSKRAAPIIVEMLRKQEGWDSGYYTGIATAADGKLYMEKAACNLETLLKKTDITQLPGNVGMIHGRSQGVEGDEYAHPFVGKGGKIAYLANGCSGFFKDFPGKRTTPEVYEDLMQKGYPCPTLLAGDYKMLPGGYKVHNSDLKCQHITQYVDSGMSVTDAMETAYCEHPAEVVGLLLHADYPDRIFFARINYPMFIGVADHGIYIATTPMVFPEDARDITLLSPMSAGEVYRDRYLVKPFKKPPFSVAPLTAQVIRDGFDAVVEALDKADMDHDQIDILLRSMIPGECPPESALDYMILYELQKQGRLKIKSEQMPGVKEGSIRTKFIASLIK